MGMLDLDSRSIFKFVNYQVYFFQARNLTDAIKIVLLMNPLITLIRAY